jgi:hypothetical protein
MSESKLLRSQKTRKPNGYMTVVDMSYLVTNSVVDNMKLDPACINNAKKIARSLETFNMLFSALSIKGK